MKTFVCVFLTICTVSGGAFAQGSNAQEPATMSTTKSTKTSTVFGDLSSVDTLRWLP